MSAVAVYDRLVELAERERDLIEAGRYDELAELDTERGGMVALLPPRPPAEAAAPLRHAAALQEQNTRALAAALVQTREGVLELRRGRRTARGYAPGQTRSGGLLDRQAG